MMGVCKHSATCLSSTLDHRQDGTGVQELVLTAVLQCVSMIYTNIDIVDAYIFALLLHFLLILRLCGRALAGK